MNISIIKQWVIRIKWMPADLLNRIVMRLRHICYGKKLLTYGPIFIRGTGKIQIGDNVKITSCREANPIGGDVRTILYTPGKGRIYIGNRTGISNVTIVARERVTIEDDVFVGGNCKIYDNDFHSLNFHIRTSKQDMDICSKPVLIKKGAFIGAHCIILKGTTIGENSVIGAGSVVIGTIPDGEIWAGNPARFIRRV